MSRASESAADDVVGKAYDARMVRRLLPFLKPYRRSFALGLVLLVAIAAFELVQPYIAKVAVDGYMLQGDARGTLVMAGFYALALAAVFAILNRAFHLYAF